MRAVEITGTGSADKEMQLPTALRTPISPNFTGNLGSRLIQLKENFLSFSAVVVWLKLDS